MTVRESAKRDFLTFLTFNVLCSHHIRLSRQNLNQVAVRFVKKNARRLHVHRQFEIAIKITSRIAYKFPVKKNLANLGVDSEKPLECPRTMVMANHKLQFEI